MMMMMMQIAICWGIGPLPSAVGADVVVQLQSHDRSHTLWLHI
jgi:hypothetical protein